MYIATAGTALNHLSCSWIWGNIESSSRLKHLESYATNTSFNKFIKYQLSSQIQFEPFFSNTTNCHHRNLWQNFIASSDSTTPHPTGGKKPTFASSKWRNLDTLRPSTFFVRKTQFFFRVEFFPGGRGKSGRESCMMFFFFHWKRLEDVFLSVSKSPPVKRPNIHGCLCGVPPSLSARLGSGVQVVAQEQKYDNATLARKLKAKQDGWTGGRLGGWTATFGTAHYGSMEKWYIHLHEWLIFMVNVGEYTSPMDPMGHVFFWELQNYPPGN